MTNNQLKIEKLKKEIETLQRDENQTPLFSFSKITFKDLKSLVKIDLVFETGKFSEWFSYEYKFSERDLEFFANLIQRNSPLIESYREEDLKIKMITPILNRVDFLDFQKGVRDFYEEPITYTNENFTFSGTTDFLVSKGLEFSETPYFFIQEFKKSIKNDDPRPQLLAEMISAIELNSWENIKGAYIVGSIWNFVILEKVGENSYQYSTSENFDSTKIEDLKRIYKNLLFVKDEILNV
jgi:hypothetical protein